MWLHKWRSHRVLLEMAEGYEAVEVPVYRSTGGPLFKTLLSSACRMDCLYCPVARYRRIERRVWDRRVLVEAFLEAYRRGIVKGLFISSGLYGDPDRVVEDVLEVVEELRNRGYQGYVHVRLMPGTSPRLVRLAARLANRVGLNLEAPGPSHFSEIAPSKGSWSVDLLSRLLYAARVTGNPGRVDTQLVVGASGETDLEIMLLVEKLVAQGVGIVHFSPYVPVPGTPLAERVRSPTPAWRSRLLYEAWSLIRFYGFRVSDIEPVLDDKGMLPPLRASLKEAVAREHPDWFPVDVNTATVRELVRVPGIGPKSAKKIVKLREERGRLTPFDVARVLGMHRWRRAARYLAF